MQSETEPGAGRRLLTYLGTVQPPPGAPRSRWARIVDPRSDSSPTEVLAGVVWAVVVLAAVLNLAVRRSTVLWPLAVLASVLLSANLVRLLLQISRRWARR